MRVYTREHREGRRVPARGIHAVECGVLRFVFVIVVSTSSEVFLRNLISLALPALDVQHEVAKRADITAALRVGALEDPRVMLPSVEMRLEVPFGTRWEFADGADPFARCRVIHIAADLPAHSSDAGELDAALDDPVLAVGNEKLFDEAAEGADSPGATCPLKVFVHRRHRAKGSPAVCEALDAPSGVDAGAKMHPQTMRRGEQTLAWLAVDVGMNGLAVGVQALCTFARL